jgi:alpha-galactosidase
MKLLPPILGVLIAMANLPLAHAVTVQPDEMATCRKWIAAKLEGVQVEAPRPGLEVVRNFDPVQKNARFGKPLHIGGVSYTRGLFCHANSQIIVRLPGPGKTFTAVVGVDTNEQTTPGRGSVIFSVDVGGKQAFKSPIMREGMDGVPVEVPLAGAREFVISVGDSGDGISCDQSDWADAKITLADGSAVWLADLPLADGPALTNAELPFSFTYGGHPSSELLPKWRLERSTRTLDAQRTERTLTFTDPQTGLVVRCVAVEYADFPTVEWTLYFRNTGAAAGPQGRPADTPILENIHALDLGLERGHYGEFTLHHAVGSPCQVNDYQPIASPLAPGTTMHIGAAGGRPTNSDLSYFSLEAPVREGLIIVVGWPGQWASEWTRDGDIGLRVRAGQELTHLKLHPGEEIRTPLVVLQFWNGDWMRAQNIWRRWMLAHNVPRPAGKLPEPELFGCSSHLFGEMVEANEKNQIECIDRYLDERIPIRHWWMDAGWYPCADGGWPKTGTWEVDKTRFPNGLRAISDHAHKRGVKTIVWFEPERVAAGTWLTQNHPEWILGGAGGGLLNLGNPDARQWLTDHVDHLLTEQGIDLYRQDFNMDPLGFWRANDAEDRQGITEIRHVEGYLAYWDELLRRHPGMFIDSCASGGRRNDLETMRRAIPLWRTDWRCEPVGTQCCTYGISMWIPLSGTGAADADAYTFRSNMVPFTNCLFDVRNRRLDYDLLRRLTAQWQSIAPYYTGDFWPLTPYSTETGAWMAWQFDRPDLGEGCVQVFRRADSVYEAARLKLRGLDPEAKYEVRDVDEPKAKTLSGRDLMSPGLLVNVKDQPGALVITYRRVAGAR